MRKTTIYRFHTQDKTYVFADKRTPEQVMAYCTKKYEKIKPLKNFHCFKYELFEHQTPDITAIEQYEGTRGEIRSRVKHYREQFNCITLDPDIIAKHDRLSLLWREEDRKRAIEYARNKKEIVATRKRELREKINTRKREYYHANKEKNKDKMNARAREYHEKNREKINTHKREKITCECGAVVARGYMSRHKNAKKHKKNMPEPEKKTEVL